MSNEMTLFAQGGNALPAHLRGLELDATTKALMGGGTGKRISIRGGVFRMIVGGKEVAQNDDRAMNVVLVRSAEKTSRSYYAGTYVEGQNAAPACYSNDGVTPAADSKNKQSPNCANCPQNIKGSGQGDSRACRFSHRLAVVLENNLEGDVYQLTLPAQSIFGTGDNGKMPLQQYAKFLGGHGIPVTAVVTEMRFDTSSATPKLTFRAMRPLSVDEMATAKSQGDTPDALNAVTMTVSQMDGEAKPTGSPFAGARPMGDLTREEDGPAYEQIATKAKKAAVDAVDEPVKRASAKKAEVKDVASVLDEWADDAE
jgi:hypothetical protein